jgi:hypothetical protein
MTKLIFCANCQIEKLHTIEILPLEILADCECGRVIKFPPLKNAGALRAMFDNHRDANLGQVPAVEYVPDTDVTSAIENA